jgi:hypothetical protein
MTGSTGSLKVERWKGEMVEWFPRNKLRQTICRVIPACEPGSSGRGGKIRLPQRPEVSSKQATPLPLPNRFRQPTKQTPPSYILCHPGQRPGIQSFEAQKQAPDPEASPLLRPIRAHPRLLSASICVNRVSRDPVSGVAKSVCHRDRRSLPNRQLRCLCRTDFGSPIPRQSAPFILVYLREPLDPGSSLFRVV